MSGKPGTTNDFFANEQMREIGMSKRMPPSTGADDRDALGEAGIEAGDEAFLAGVGRRVREGRAKHGMTRKQLAAASGTSERYLALIESGKGNPSVGVLQKVAEALALAPAQLLPAHGRLSTAHAAVMDLIAGMPEARLASMGEAIRSVLVGNSQIARARRIALIGLRGAGKSTLGRLLADRLAVPFIELNRTIEQEYGAAIPLLMEMAGPATFRRYERECLERVVAGQQACVLATAGGIVSAPETFNRLLETTHTVWIKARPEDHMGRVMNQGDFRPMAANREAMTDLKAILEARAGDYARAEAALNTSDSSIDASATDLEAVARQLLGS